MTVDYLNGFRSFIFSSYEILKYIWANDSTSQWVVVEQEAIFEILNYICISFKYCSSFTEK